MSTTHHWNTNDELGVIAFATRKEAAKAVPGFRQIRGAFAMGFGGWLAIDPYGSDNASTIQAPDGRRIPVVMGWCNESKQRVIGMRAGTPKASRATLFREIMGRVIENGLAVHAYSQS